MKKSYCHRQWAGAGMMAAATAAENGAEVTPARKKGTGGQEVKDNRKGQDVI